jgi:hypothetical protein
MSQPSWVSAGTSLLDFSAPQESTNTQTLFGSNYIIAKVNSAKQVLTSAQLQQLLDAGYDVEVISPS